MFGKKPATIEYEIVPVGAPANTAYQEWEKARRAAYAAWPARCEAFRAQVSMPEEAYRIVRNTRRGTWTVQKPRIAGPEPPSNAGALDYYLHNRTAFDRMDRSSAPDWACYDHDAPDEQIFPAKVVWEQFGPVAEFPTLERAECWLRAWIEPVDEVRRYTDRGLHMETRYPPRRARAGNPPDWKA